MDRDHEVFVTIVEQGSLAGAARKLRISTPMVSKRLARLEARLGTELIHRTTRRCATTNIGQAFYEDIAQIITATQEAEGRAKTKAGTLSGELRVRTINSFGRTHLARHIGSFLADHPQINIEIDVADRPIDLIGSQIDVEITLSTPDREGMMVTPLTRDQRFLCASPAYIARRGAPTAFEDLYQHDIVAASLQLPWTLSGPEGKVIFHGRSITKTNSSEMPTALALAGVGIALPSHWVVVEELRRGQLVRVLESYESAADLQLCAVYPRSRLVSPNVRAFISHMVKACAEDVAAGPGPDPVTGSAPGSGG